MICANHECGKKFTRPARSRQIYCCKQCRIQEQVRRNYEQYGGVNKIYPERFFAKERV